MLACLSTCSSCYIGIQLGIGSSASWEEGSECRCLLEWFTRSKTNGTIVEEAYHLRKFNMRVKFKVGQIGRL